MPATGMSCKTVLEPCLDGVSRYVWSFAPMAACIGQDLWREERIVDEFDEFRYTLLVSTYPCLIAQHLVEHFQHLRRAIAARDMHRYLTYYAPRIRTFTFLVSDGVLMPSLESFRALELFTESRPGALSPLLKEFTWQSWDDVALTLGEDIGKHLYPSLFLFLGGTVDSLEIEHGITESILHKASIGLSMKRLGADLKTLTLAGKSHFKDFCADFELPKLEHLFWFNAPGDIIPHLAKLPRLQGLTLWGLSCEDLRLCLPNSTGLSRICSVVGSSGYFLAVQNILQCLAPSNGLRLFEWGGRLPRTLQTGIQAMLDALKEHCNPFTLNSVLLKSSKFLEHDGDEESAEMEDPGEVDLSPLYSFKQLEYLDIQVQHSIMITRRTLAEIATSWPQLRCLVLCPQYSSGRVPLISHDHVLGLVHNLPSLRELGIQFDATRIPEIEQDVVCFSKLRIFRVGGSPIYSPSRAAAYLKSHFPFLEQLDIDYAVRPYEGTLSVQRWKVVKNIWKASRDVQ
ncbi:hypothetical protein NMY22_g6287 [Coprinellus aureogranulatus]|nr:hypothetical protein NMY22_g6287 [Coprinellus aureogranulatus]